jgi:hypothetical protein
VHGKERLISARPVWPEAIDGTVVFGAVMAVAGFALVMAIHRLARRHARD